MAGNPWEKRRATDFEQQKNLLLRQYLVPDPQRLSTGLPTDFVRNFCLIFNQAMGRVLARVCVSVMSVAAARPITGDMLTEQAALTHKIRGQACGYPVSQGSKPLISNRNFWLLNIAHQRPCTGISHSWSTASPSG
jgi:hypothetical protein